MKEKFARSQVFDVGIVLAVSLSKQIEVLT